MKYRVIHKSFRDIRPLRFSSRDVHAEGEHVNRGRDTPSFCPALQVLDMSTLGDAADVNPVTKFLPHTLHVCGRNLITGLTSGRNKPQTTILCMCIACWIPKATNTHSEYEIPIAFPLQNLLHVRTSMLR